MPKIITIAVILAVIIIYLKSVNSELSMLATVGAGIILFISVFDYLTDAIDLFSNLINATGVDKELYVIIFKITAIGYLIEFASSTIQDFGLKSLADKLVFAGKLIIISVSMPIIYAVFNLFKGLLQ